MIPTFLTARGSLWLLRTSVAVAMLGVTVTAFAWGNHRYGTYRAFEAMPEVASAQPVKAEPLVDFLKAQEKGVESLLQQQDQWAKTNLDYYPALPENLVFKADPRRSAAELKTAFLQGLRVSPAAPFALYFQVDPRKERPRAAPLPHASVSTLPPSMGNALSFFALQPGDGIAPLAVLATASDEPDLGLDIGLFEDSPTPWGKTMGLGKQAFGNPTLPYTSQIPFHMGFYHESPVIYAAAGFVKRTLPLMRVHQYTTLSQLAFQTGHAYWGWRFAGIALHYVQDLTQPFHASLSPGLSTARIIGVNVLAMAGVPKYKEQVVTLLSNRHLVLEYYQSSLMFGNALAAKDTHIERSLRDMTRDAKYPPWSDRYVRDVSSAEAFANGPALVDTLLETMPQAYVANPDFDFGSKANDIALVDEVGQGPSAKLQVKMEKVIGDLLANFGSHSRNTVRGILRTGNGI
jgi:hypothetical protein